MKRVDVYALTDRQIVTLADMLSNARLDKSAAIERQLAESFAAEAARIRKHASRGAA